MPHITKVASCCYTQEQMFELVADIPAYTDFVPACSESRIVLKQNPHTCHARLRFTQWGIRINLLTKNTHFPYERIKMDLVEGDLKHLSGEWLFEKHPEGCSIRLSCEYEINIALRLVLGRSIDAIWGTLLRHIVLHAGYLYGKE